MENSLGSFQPVKEKRLEGSIPKPAKEGSRLSETWASARLGGGDSESDCANASEGNRAAKQTQGGHNEGNMSLLLLGGLWRAIGGGGEWWEVEDRDADGEKQSWCVLWGTGARFANQALLDPNLARATADEALGRHYGGTAQAGRAPVWADA